MSKLRLEKVIGDVPSSLYPDCIYMIRTASGFDLRVSDKTGSIAHYLNSPSANLDADSILAIPIADFDFFDYAVVVQNGILKRMPFSYLSDVLSPGFDPSPFEESVYWDSAATFVNDEYVLYSLYDSVDRMIYDYQQVSYSEDILVYPDDNVVTFGNDIFYFGTTELVFG